MVVRPADGNAEFTVDVPRVREPLNKSESKWLALAIALHGELAKSLLSANDPAKVQEVCERGLSLRRWIPADYREEDFIAKIYNIRLRLARALHQLNQTPKAIETMKLAVAEATQADAKIASTAVHSVIDYRKLASTMLASLGDITAGRAELEAAVELQRKTRFVKPDPVEDRRFAETLLAFAEFVGAHDEQPAASTAPSREAFDIFLGLLDHESLAIEERNSLRESIIQLGRRLYTAYKKTGGAEEHKYIADILLPIITASLNAARESGESGREYSLAKQAVKSFEELGFGKQAIEASARAVELFEKHVQESGKGRFDLVYDYYNFAALATRQSDLERADVVLSKCRDLAASELDPQKDIEINTRILALSALICVERKRFTEIGPLVQQALDRPLPTENEPLIRRSGDVLISLYGNLATYAINAGASEQAVAVAARRCDVARRLLELENDSKRHEQFILALDGLGRSYLKAAVWEQAAVAYIAMQQAAVDAQVPNANVRFADLEADAADSAGRMRVKQERLDEAEASFRHAAELWQKLCEKGDLPKARFVSLASALGSLATISEKREQWDAAVQRTQQRVDALGQAYQGSSDPTERERIANGYLSLAWYQLFNRQPQAAIEASLKCMEVSPEFFFAATNLISGYLMTNQYDKALEVYDKYKAKSFGDNTSLHKILQDDFKQLRTAGIDHPDMKKFEARLDDK